MEKNTQNTVTLDTIMAQGLPRRPAEMVFSRYQRLQNMPSRMTSNNLAEEFDKARRQDYWQSCQ